MAFIYEYLVAAGVTATHASVCTAAVFFLCVATLLRIFSGLCK